MTAAPVQRERLRVLFITQEYSPIYGGVGTSAQRLARGLAGLGVDLRVATFDSKRPLTEDDYLLEEVDQEFGFRITRVGPFFHGHAASDPDLIPEPKRAEFRRRMFDQILPMARRFDPDIVLSFYALDAGLLGAYLSRALGVPHVSGVRGNDVGRGMFDHNAIASLATVVESSDRIVCVNQYLLERLHIAFPQAAKRSMVIPNAVHLPSTVQASGQREYIRRHTNWSGSDVVIVFLGTLREKKGTTVLLDAIADASERAAVRLLVVGPTPVPSDFLRCGALWEELSHRGLLHCTGKIERAAALQIVSEGDILVMPSVDDGMANALLEGMALGLCPVVTDVFTDVVDPTCGYIVERNNRKQLADAFVQVAEVPERRRQLGAVARQRVAALHQPKREAEAYRTLLAECASSRGASG